MIRSFFSIRRALRRPARQGAFTLVELLVAVSILTVLLVIVSSMVSQTSQVWRSTNSRIEAFQGARLAFSTLVRNLSQTTLNTYWDYDNPNQPQRYIRQSELHFIVDQAEALLPADPQTEYYGQGIFFQSPANKAEQAAYEGLSGLLNASGFYVAYGSDEPWLPQHLTSQARNRFRLIGWLESSENLKVYMQGGHDWIGTQSGQSYPLANNVIALVIWPREQDRGTSTLNSYQYDSRAGARNSPQPVTANQLPAVLEVAMVAIDEASAFRLGEELKATIDECLEGLFATDPSAKFTSDLDELETRLSERNVEHRIFMSSITLREAKWSAP